MSFIQSIKPKTKHNFLRNTVFLFVAFLTVGCVENRKSVYDTSQTGIIDFELFVLLLTSFLLLIYMSIRLKKSKTENMLSITEMYK